MLYSLNKYLPSIYYVRHLDIAVNFMGPAEHGLVEKTSNKQVNKHITYTCLRIE